MYKKIALVGMVILGTGIIGNEFVKPAREKRKEKMQQDVIGEDCIKLMDTLMGRMCALQEQLGMLTGTFYRILRSCAADDTPVITQFKLPLLKDIQRTLQALEKQMQSFESIIAKDACLQEICLKI